MARFESKKPMGEEYEVRCKGFYEIATTVGDELTMPKEERSWSIIHLRYTLWWSRQESLASYFSLLATTSSGPGLAFS